MPSARPAGTDGSDHGYREKIEADYKGAPIWRAAGWLFLHFTALPTTAKALWALMPFYTQKIFPNLTGISLMGVYLIALLCWTLARPGTYKERFAWVKATNGLVMIGTVMSFLSIWKSHIMDAPQQLTSRILWKYVTEERGWPTKHWLYNVDNFGRLEAFIDGSCAVAWACTFYCLHQYITKKMEMEKRLKQAKKQRESASKDEDSSTPVRTPASAPRNRRPGRA